MILSYWLKAHTPRQGCLNRMGNALNVSRGRIYANALTLTERE